MNIWQPHLLRQEALGKAEERLSQDPEDIEARFDQARLLTELGRTAEAQQAYLEILKRSPAHFGALNNLGTLLRSMGYQRAARTVFTEAVAQHPDQPMGHVNLANLLREDEAETARAHYQTALRLDPDYADAHKGLALLLMECGENEAALRHQQAGFAKSGVTVLPYRGQMQPVPVILLVSAANGNAPFQKLLDDTIFLVTVVVAEFYESSLALPPHHLVVNAIGDADLCGEALAGAKALMQCTEAPVINRPAAVLATGRVANSARFAATPEIVAPKMLELQRETLMQPDADDIVRQHGLSYPFLMRSPGFHTGRYFQMIERPNDLTAHAAKLPGKNLSLIQYLDASGADGKIRKYRVMMIDGAFYPAHVAISQNWKVHYFTADMADHPEHRAEDEAFLHDMPAAIGATAMRALAHIRDTLDLDYAGVDFGLNAAGQLLFFEANAAMTINPPPAGEQWDYRREPVEKILEATRRLLWKKCATVF